MDSKITAALPDYNLGLCAVLVWRLQRCVKFAQASITHCLRALNSARLFVTLWREIGTSPDFPLLLFYPAMYIFFVRVGQ